MMLGNGFQFLKNLLGSALAPTRNPGPSPDMGELSQELVEMKLNSSNANSHTSSYYNADGDTDTERLPIQNQQSLKDLEELEEKRYDKMYNHALNYLLKRFHGQEHRLRTLDSLCSKGRHHIIMLADSVKQYLGKPLLFSLIAKDTAEQGMLEVFKWIEENDNLWEKTHLIGEVLCAAVRKNQFDFVKYLLEGCIKRLNDIARTDLRKIPLYVKLVDQPLLAEICLGMCVAKNHPEVLPLFLSCRPYFSPKSNSQSSRAQVKGSIFTQELCKGPKTTYAKVVDRMQRRPITPLFQHLNLDRSYLPELDIPIEKNHKKKEKNRRKSW